MDLNTITVEDFNNRRDGDRTLKYCKQCKKIKTSDCFYPETGGFHSGCKTCKAFYRNKNRLSRILHNIKKRCENEYLHKGIKNYLKIKDIEFLWTRDCAALMKTPSIDRIDNNGDYEFSNCRFIEHSLNSAKDKLKSVVQISKYGDVITVFNSAKEASICLGNISAASIGKACRKERNTGGGYLWEFYKKAT